MSRARILFWLPRAIGVVAISMIAFLTITIPSESEVWLWKDLVIQSVPTYLLLILFLVATKWEDVGGGFLLVIGLLSSAYVFVGIYYLSNSVYQSLFAIMSLTVPLAIIGLLFLMHHYHRKHSI